MNKQMVCNKIKKAATKGLLYEVSVTPKPGLVDRNNNGSHKDMDIFKFIDSAVELENYFFDCAMIVFENEKMNHNKLFEMLRKRGIQADKQMLGVTKGINTHKGAIFLLGLISAGAAMSYLQNEKFSAQNICKNSGKIVSEVLEKDFLKDTSNGISKGIDIYFKYGVSGIRGEALAELPTITKHAYPYMLKLLKEGVSLNDSSVNVLLKIIVNTQDTNLIVRGGLEGMEYAKFCAENSLAKGGMLTEEGYRDIVKMDKNFIRKNLSPGGSADLLAATLMLYFL